MGEAVVGTIKASGTTEAIAMNASARRGTGLDCNYQFKSLKIGLLPLSELSVVTRSLKCVEMRLVLYGRPKMPL